MCLACEEMELYYAYLDAVEEAKKKAQPWECQVTVFPQGGEATPNAAASNTAAPDMTTPKPKPAAGGKPGFVCDEPE